MLPFRHVVVSGDLSFLQSDAVMMLLSAQTLHVTFRRDSYKCSASMVERATHSSSWESLRAGHWEA